MTARDICTECGRPPSGVYEISLHGEVTCVHHPTAGRCLFCGRPHRAGHPPGWLRITGDSLRCPTCGRGAVDTQLQARRLLPAIRADMAEVGIRLDVPVRVTVTDASTLPAVGTGGAAGLVLGVTQHQRTSERVLTDSIAIQVIAGMPPLQFGQTVAHELGHAWLAQRAGTEVDGTVEEGVCELFAHAWLKRQRTPVADAMRTNLRNNPDPVYGGGFRAVHAAVARHGIEAVLGAVCSTGNLPIQPHDRQVSVRP